MSLNITPAPPTVSAFGTGAATSTGTIVLAAGANITLNTGASSITIIGPTPSGGAATLSHTQNIPLGLVGNAPILSKVGTITGTAGLGSSLFLQRIFIPGVMSLSRVDVAMKLLFNATSDGAGTMSRTVGIYSFGNSTSLASLISVSGTSAWTTGTSTAGASSSLTQFQGGWSNIYIQPMTFASSTLAAGEYVIGELFDFAQLSSTWTLSLFGGSALTTVGAYNAVPAITLSTVSGISGSVAAGSGITGAAAASAFTATTGTALTAWTAAPSVIGVGKMGSTASFSAAAASSLMATATANSTYSLMVNAGTGAAGLLSSGGLSAGSIVTGVQAGSVLTAGGTFAAMTNLSIASVGAAATSPAQWLYIGTGSTTISPDAFIDGVSSTGALPASIALTAAGVTQTIFRKPWFALVGA